jgi:hypothetical protein
LTRRRRCGLTRRHSHARRSHGNVSRCHNIPGYAPANGDYSKQSLLAAQTEMDDKQTIAAQADAAARAARDEAVAATHRYHNKVVGMCDSVGAQYGKDSNEFQSVGRKKTTEYRRPTRRAASKKSQQ